MLPVAPVRLMFVDFNEISQELIKELHKIDTDIYCMVFYEMN